MGYIKDEIINTAKNLNISLKTLNRQEKMLLRNNIQKFFKKNTTSFLWDNFKDYTCVNHKEAWSWIKDFIKNTKCIMFFNYQDEKEVFLLDDGNVLQSLLSETDNFEFYITNEAYKYILCFNHHDTLFATGTAMAWLSSYTKKKNLITYSTIICETLKSYILSGNFTKAKSITKSLETDELENYLVEIGYDTCNIMVYVFLCDILNEKESADIHYVASVVLAIAFSHLEGAYEGGYYHAKKAIKLDSDNIGFKEHILFFYSGIPEPLLSKNEAISIAKEILKKSPKSIVALDILKK